jgi:hydroxymethylpyrimidine pyrophosphatase-like HAD family hydrolase
MSSNPLDDKKYKPIRAIFADYDGTLCSASATRDKSLGQNRISPKIKQTLQQISQHIPLCIISSKDYFFVRETQSFAKVISCLMGIETLSFDDSNAVAEQQSQLPPFHRKLLLDEGRLSALSDSLEEIAKNIESDPEFRSILVERKHTSDRRILAGITIDWRRTKNWDYYKKGVQHFVSAAVTNLSQSPKPVNLYVQKYEHHPFVDVYAIECSKSTAFDMVLSEICADRDGGGKNDHRKNIIRAEDVLYLGDSENDNPAFRKAGISIGIRSDARLKPKLDCSYFLNYEALSSFLMGLMKNDCMFTERLIVGGDKA